MKTNRQRFQREATSGANGPRAAPTVNYDHLAPGYDARYAAGSLDGLANLLVRLAGDTSPGAKRSGEADGPPARALEVGCGTGHWLSVLRPHVGQLVGLDLSAGMLRQAQAKSSASLVQGEAGALPFANASFHLVACVNALHHFPAPRAFIAEARRLLGPGGVMVNINFDPRAGRARWYLYDYFPETLDTDLKRFPSTGTLLEWMQAAGFERSTGLLVEHIVKALRGRAVLDDYFLQQGSTSQLALLSEEAYQAGLRRLRQALDAAEAAGAVLEFEADYWMSAVVGHVPGEA